VCAVDLSVHPYAFDSSVCITFLRTNMIVPNLYVVAGDGITSLRCLLVAMFWYVITKELKNMDAVLKKYCKGW
jgi:hypothetical protein